VRYSIADQAPSRWKLLYEFCYLIQQQICDRWGLEHEHTDVVHVSCAWENDEVVPEAVVLAEGDQDRRNAAIAVVQIKGVYERLCWAFLVNVFLAKGPMPKMVALAVWALGA